MRELLRCSTEGGLRGLDSGIVASTCVKSVVTVQ